MSVSTIFEEQDGLGMADLVRRGEVKPIELFEEAVRRVEEIDDKLNVLTHRAYDEGRRMALDPDLPDGPFKGVPWLVKNLGTLWQGQPTTNGCRFFESFVAPFDGEVVRRIKAAGFTLLGKTNAPEAGWAISTEPKMYGTTLNPWDTSRTPGGSSGGSAAAVAARVLPIAEASDGGGSIRVPAANCGLVGLKPSRGRISVAPHMGDFYAGGITFLCVSRTVRDTAAFLDATGGPLVGDAYFARMPETPYLQEVGADPGKLRIGMVLASPDGGTPVDPEVREGVERTARLLESLGHTVVEEAVPYDFWPLFDTYTRIGAVEVACWFDGFAPIVGRAATRHDMEPLNWTMIMKGHSVSGTQHSTDINNLRIMARGIVQRMSAYDAWLMPTAPMLPREHGYYDMSLDVDTYNDTRMGPDCVFTAPFNAVGLPAVSLPLHWSKGGLPVGIQLVGGETDETTLIRLAAQLEIAQPWKDRVPPVHA
jgi:amidase